METRIQKANPLLELKRYGQSVWLDYMLRSLMTSGELKRLVEEDGLRGMTSNPAIFEKAIGQSTDYNEDLKAMHLKKGMNAKTVYEILAIKDIQLAADILKVVYQHTDGRDGYVSMEVSPYLAHDTQGTMEEARRLWKSIDRPNVMIKVPATPEGIPAIEHLTAEGININITLVFSRDVYGQVALAYMAGLKKYAARNKDLKKIASVASFFVSRIDSAVDKILQERLSQSHDQQKAAVLKNLCGKTAIANAKLAYKSYQELFSSQEWRLLEKQGARTQRVLWASTGTKNPQYSDVLYIEELIGKDTVNTMPPDTLKAFKDHGKLRLSLTENVEDSARTMKALSENGISFQEITDKLLADAVDLFAKPFGTLLAKLEDMINKGA